MSLTVSTDTNILRLENLNLKENPMNNHATNFAAMLDLMLDMQVPIITVESVSEKHYNEWHHASKIIIPDGKDKVTVFTFIDTYKDTDFLAQVHSMDMSFGEAIMVYSEEVLRHQGGLMAVHSN